MPSTPFAVRARGLTAATPDRVLFRDLDLTVTTTTRLGVVGPNGSGKSTLLRLLAGELAPERGQVERVPATTTVTLVPQEPDRSPVETAREYVARRTGVAAATHELTLASEALADDPTAGAARYDAALDAYLRLGCADFDERLAGAAADVGLPDDLLDRPTAHLSGGEAARVALTAALVARGDVLLLDEPTNDLDADGLRMLESLVARTRSALAVVSHDRVFLERTVTSVVELAADGSATTFDGGWTAYLEQRAAERRRAEEAYQRYDEERQRLREQARREREWAHKGVRRAATSGETDKFIRFGAKQGAQNGGRRAARTERALDRLEPVHKPWEGWELRFSIAAADRAGAVVAELDEVTVRRGARLLGPWTMVLSWGERVALTGPNGVGKTTLVDVLAGRLAPTAGTVRVGPSVVLGELRQQRAEAAAAGDLLAWFLDRSGLPISEGRSLLAKFGLSAEHLARPPSSLSTGERTRADLALFQARGVNLLVLDEPTNHLDLEAIEQLESALATYPGTLLVISHDRRFLEHLAVDRSIDLAAQPAAR